jgi:hypothetical protein
VIDPHKKVIPMKAADSIILFHLDSKITNARFKVPRLFQNLGYSVTKIREFFGFEIP